MRTYVVKLLKVLMEFFFRCNNLNKRVTKRQVARVPCIILSVVECNDKKIINIHERIHALPITGKNISIHLITR